MIQAMAESVAGAVESDETLTGRASRQRTDEQPTKLRQAKGEDSEAISVETHISLLRAFYDAAIAFGRRDLPSSNRAAALNTLRRRLKAAIPAVTLCA